MERELRLRDYPFLVGLDEFSARELGFRPSIESLASDPRLRQLALEAIRAAAEEKPPQLAPSDSVEAVLSFYLSLALAKSVGGALLNSLASLYSSMAANALNLEDEDTVITIARAAGLPVERRGATLSWSLDRSRRLKRRILPYSVHVVHYLRAARGSQRADLRLVNQFLLGGRVFLDKSRLISLLRERFKEIILDRAEHIDTEGLPGDVVDAARAEYERALRRRSGLPWAPEHLPSCVARAFKDIAESNARDEEVYLAATFAGAISATPEELAEAMGLDAGDPRVRGLARLAREAHRMGFTVYTCQALREMGFCAGDEGCRGPDPLREYLRRTRRSNS